MRAIIPVFLSATLTFLLGCRCQSELGNPASFNDERGTGKIPPNVATYRWCKACALKNFLACKRVDGYGTEEEIRRKVELTACKEVGYSEQQCTEEKLRFVECGLERPPAKTLQQH